MQRALRFCVHDRRAVAEVCSPEMHLAARGRAKRSECGSVVLADLLRPSGEHFLAWIALLATAHSELSRLGTALRLV
jgi:hypothetical protein